MDASDDEMAELCGLNEDDFKGVQDDEDDDGVQGNMQDGSARINLPLLECWVLTTDKRNVEKLYQTVKSDPKLSSGSLQDEEKSLTALVVRISWLIVNGRYADILRLPIALEVFGPKASSDSDGASSVAEFLRESLAKFLSRGSTSFCHDLRATIALFISIATLNIFLQV